MMLVQSERHPTSYPQHLQMDSSSKPIFLKNIYDFVDQNFKHKRKTTLFDFINHIAESHDWQRNPLIPRKSSKINVFAKSEQTMNLIKKKFIYKNDFLSNNSSDKASPSLLLDEEEEYSCYELLDIFILKVCSYFLTRALKMKDKPVLKYVKYKSRHPDLKKLDLVKDLLNLLLSIIKPKIRQTKTSLTKKEAKQIRRLFSFVKYKEVKKVLLADLKACHLFFKSGVIFHFKHQDYEHSFQLINEGFGILNQRQVFEHEDSRRVHKQKQKTKDFFEGVLKTAKTLREFQMKRERKNLAIMAAREELNMLEFDEANKHQMYYQMLLGHSRNSDVFREAVSKKKKKRKVKKKRRKRKTRKSSSEGFSESNVNSESSESESLGYEKKDTQPKKMSVSMSIQKSNSHQLFAFPSESSYAEHNPKLKTMKNISHHYSSSVKSIDSKNSPSESVSMQYNINVISEKSDKMFNKAFADKKIRQRKVKKNEHNIGLDYDSVDSGKYLYSNHLLREFNGSDIEEGQSLVPKPKDPGSEHLSIDWKANQDRCFFEDNNTSKKGTNSKIREVTQKVVHQKEPLYTNNKESIIEDFPQSKQEVEFFVPKNSQKLVEHNKKNLNLVEHEIERFDSKPLNYLINHSLPITNKNKNIHDVPPGFFFESKGKYSNSQLNAIMDTPHFDFHHPNVHLPLEGLNNPNPFTQPKQNFPRTQLQSINLPFNRSDISPIESSSNLEANQSNRKYDSRFTFHKASKIPTYTSIESRIASNENHIQKNSFNKSKTVKDKLNLQSIPKTSQVRLPNIKGISIDSKLVKYSPVKLSTKDNILYIPKTISSKNKIDESDLSMDQSSAQSISQFPSSDKKIDYQIKVIPEPESNQNQTQSRSSNKTSSQSGTRLTGSDLEMVNSYVYLQKVNSSGASENPESSKFTNSSYSKSNKNVFYK